MLDFEIQRCTRRCHKLDREFQPGETFYSVLIRDGADIVRRDFSEVAWDGPPPDSVGCWKSQMVEAGTKGPQWAPNDVIRDYFRQLENDEQQADLRYVLGLLMVRRRLMRLDGSETDPAGCELLVLYCPQDDQEHRLPVCPLSPERAQEIQDELGKLLFASG